MQENSLSFRKIKFSDSFHIPASQLTQTKLRTRGASARWICPPCQQLWMLATGQRVLAVVTPSLETYAIQLKRAMGLLTV